jgi:hypothetical protein
MTRSKHCCSLDVLQIIIIIIIIIIIEVLNIQNSDFSAEQLPERYFVCPHSYTEYNQVSKHPLQNCIIKVNDTYTVACETCEITN